MREQELRTRSRVTSAESCSVTQRKNVNFGEAITINIKKKNKTNLLRIFRFEILKLIYLTLHSFPEGFSYFKFLYF